MNRTIETTVLDTFEFYQKLPLKQIVEQNEALEEAPSFTNIHNSFKAFREASFYCYSLFKND